MFSLVVTITLVGVSMVTTSAALIGISISATRRTLGSLSEEQTNWFKSTVTKSSCVVGQYSFKVAKNDEFDTEASMGRLRDQTKKSMLEQFDDFWSSRTHTDTRVYSGEQNKMFRCHALLEVESMKLDSDESGDPSSGLDCSHSLELKCVILF